MSHEHQITPCGELHAGTAGSTNNVSQPGPWMWTAEQWAEIVRCARAAAAIRQKTRIDRSMFRTSGARWLLADAMRGERHARGNERRVRSMLRMWAPETEQADSGQQGRMQVAGASGSDAPKGKGDPS